MNFTKSPVPKGTGRQEHQRTVDKEQYEVQDNVQRQD